MYLGSIIIVTLPDNKGWCFSTEHTDLEIEGATPITFYLGGRYRTLEEIYDMCKRYYGDLYFNPIAKYEPDYSAEYCEEMKEWRVN